MAKLPFNVRLPKATHQQIEELAAELGLNKTQVFIAAIERMAREGFTGEGGEGETRVQLLNVRLPESTFKQLKNLEAEMGTTETQTSVLAIDRMARARSGGK